MSIALLKTLKKVGMIGRSASGVLEGAVDTDLPYVNYGGDNDARGNDVAIVDAPANDLAMPVDASGNLLSSVTPLGTTTLTTSSAKTKGYGRIVGTVFSDTAGNLKVQQSNDGLNWDLSVTDAVTGNTGLSFSHEVVGLYVRFVYAPTTSQAVFRFYPLLRRLGSA